jgi:hypothetical protein
VTLRVKEIVHMGASTVEVKTEEGNLEAALAQHQVKRVFEATLNQVEVGKPRNKRIALACHLQNLPRLEESTRRQVNSRRLASAKKITRR